MARVIKQLGEHGNLLYPWEQWTDGRAWEVRQGEDFSSRPERFRNMLFTVARRHGMAVRTRLNGDVVQFQFYHPEEDE